MKEVATFALQINPTSGKGAIYLKYTDGSNKKLDVGSVQEFAAIALILSHSPVYESPDGTLEYKGQ
ncbi:MAG: hypothetical protein QOJ64_3752 [Acidobacteriota bacterium]|jgi:hypothetical protein|nr:hypothetical protein [Acidobacteriota bacterium]